MMYKDGTTDSQSEDVLAGSWLCSLGVIVLCLCIGITAILLGSRPTPYESYNDAITACKYTKDMDQYKNCIVMVSSTYTKLLTGKKLGEIDDRANK